MAKRQNRDEGTKRESVYRGRLIEVVSEPPRPGGRVGEQPSRSRLFIDGQEIEIEEAVDGVLSHQNMFRVYSSPFELAEDLIRQWGDQAIKPAAMPDDHDHGHTHDHNHDHHRAGGTDAGAGRQGRSTAGARVRKPR
jgi:hypothetical protein